MADYHFPTVVAPLIPEGDLTPLERLVIGAAFEIEEDGENGLYLFSSEGAGDCHSFPIAELRAAHEASRETESRLLALVEALLQRNAAELEGDAYVDLDLTKLEWGVIEVLQDIVRRSRTVDEIVLTTSYTCTRMVPDGFGGSVTRVTAQALQQRSTIDLLEQLQDEVPL